MLPRRGPKRPSRNTNRRMPSPSEVPVPRGCGERAIAGLLAILFGLLSSATYFSSRSWAPVDFTERLYKALIGHVFFSVAGICLGVLIWSLFTPRWMDRLIVRVQSRIVRTLLAVIVLSAISIIAALYFQ